LSGAFRKLMNLQRIVNYVICVPQVPRAYTE